MLVAEHDKTEREERLVKALRDNLRRRKAARGSAAEVKGKVDASLTPKPPDKSKQPS
jgi:hypothetical protein